MRFKRFVFTAAAALFVTSTAFPTQNLVVKLFVTTVKQDSPVQVVGFKYPDKGPGYPGSDNDTQASCLLDGYCPKVVLHNGTAKDVKFIAVGGIVGTRRVARTGKSNTRLGKWKFFHRTTGNQR